MKRIFQRMIKLYNMPKEIKPAKSIADIKKKSNKKTILAKPKVGGYSANWKNLLGEINAEKQENKTAIAYPNKRKYPFKTKTQKVDAKIWFEGVSKEDLLAAEGKIDIKVTEMQNENKKAKITKILGIDCEMVGTGFNGKTSQLARVTIVNDRCECVYDKYVQPTEKVTDFRTRYSGITPASLNNAEQFTIVQQEVADILKDNIIVGHSVGNDFNALMLTHPRSHIRDTSTYTYLQTLTGKTKKTSLKFLSKNILGIDIQTNEHCSLEDASCAMKLYLLHKKQWENDIRTKKLNNNISAWTKE